MTVFHFGTELNAVLLTIALVAGVAELASPQERKRKEVRADSYEVYSAVLAQHYGTWFKQKEPVLILPHTVLEPQGHQGCGSQTEQSTVVRRLLDKLLAEKEQFQIAPKLQLPGKYRILTTKAEIRENAEPGVVFLSSVEFSEDRSKAMMLVGHNCGGLCGDGHVWILDKGKDGWRMSKDQLNCGWIK
jgi:hypothetical protein